MMSGRYITSETYFAVMLCQITYRAKVGGSCVYLESWSVSNHKSCSIHGT